MILHREALTIYLQKEQGESAEGKSSHLFIGNVSTQGKDTQLQSCGAEVTVACAEQRRQY